MNLWLGVKIVVQSSTRKEFSDEEVCRRITLSQNSRACLWPPLSFSFPLRGSNRFPLYTCCTLAKVNSWLIIRMILSWCMLGIRRAVEYFFFKLLLCLETQEKDLRVWNRAWAGRRAQTSRSRSSVSAVSEFTFRHSLGTDSEHESQTGISSCL